MSKGKIVVGLVTILMLVLGGTAYASVNADGHSQSAGEVLLEGDILEQVVAAAIAEVGQEASVVRAETDADGNASYEVHMVRPDGSLLTVYVDESFVVVSVVEQPITQIRDNGVDGKNDGSTKPWGEHRADEILLEGDILEQVVAAAIAEVGEDARVLRAETDADGRATYEVHVLTADGRLVTVYVDGSFAVFGLAENASPGPGWMGVLRGKLKIRDRDGEKIKYRDYVGDRDQEDLGEDQDDGAKDGSTAGKSRRSHGKGKFKR